MYISFYKKKKANLPGFKKKKKPSKHWDLWVYHTKLYTLHNRTI